MARVGLAFSLTLLLGAAPAGAYNVATSSTGVPIHWTEGTVSFVLAQPTPGGLDPAALRAAIVNSAATWSDALADRGVIVQIAEDDATSTARADDGVNTIRWALDPSDPDLERGVLARTFTIYHAGNGELRDTDIVLDAADFVWTTDPSICEDEYDVESAMTHEIGHALGLAHSVGHSDATMYATGDACETGKRDLAPDDLAGLDELYPAPTPEATGCAATPRASGWGPVLLALAVLARRRRQHRGGAAR